MTTQKTIIINKMTLIIVGR